MYMMFFTQHFIHRKNGSNIQEIKLEENLTRCSNGWKFCVQSYLDNGHLNLKKPKKPLKTLKTEKRFLKNLGFFQP